MRMRLMEGDDGEIAFIWTLSYDGFVSLDLLRCMSVNGVCKTPVSMMTACVIVSFRALKNRQLGLVCEVSFRQTACNSPQNTLASGKISIQLLAYRVREKQLYFFAFETLANGNGSITIHRRFAEFRETLKPPFWNQLNYHGNGIPL